MVARELEADRGATSKSKMAAAKLVQLAQYAYRAGLPHLLASLFFVQGLTYLSQLFIAGLMGPADFGVVRSTEVTLSIFTLIGAIGMPSIAVKSIAEINNPSLRGVLLGRLLKMAAIAGFVTSSLAAATASLWLPDPARPYFTALVWIIGIAALSRTCINYFQGIKLFRLVSGLNVTLSILSLVTLMTLVARYGLRGWVAGRYAGELLFVCGGVLMVRGSLRLTGVLPPAYAYGRLLSLGLPIAFSLLVRTALDNAALLSLAHLKRPAAEVGQYGLSAMIVTGVLLVPASVVNLAVPRLVERLQQSRALAWEFCLRIMRWILPVSLLGSLVLMVTSPLLVLVFGSEYRPAVRLLRILCLSLPMRAMTILAGTMLLANDKNYVTLLGNLTLLALASVLYASAIPAFGSSGAAWVTVVVEGGSMVFFVWASRRSVCV